MRAASFPLACGVACGLALWGHGAGAASVGVSIFGQPFVFFDDIEVQPNGDVRSERLDLIACDGSVRLATETCDGSVINVQEIAIDLSFFRNPGSDVAVQVLGGSPLFDITVAFAMFTPGFAGLYDLTLEGQYELERFRDATGAYLPGDIVLKSVDTYLPMPDHLTGGRFGHGNPIAVKHGMGDYVLPEFPQGQSPQPGNLLVTGALMSGMDAMTFGQVLCQAGDCEFTDTIISMMIDNPGGGDYRAKVYAQMTWQPSTAVIPLPAAGWLLLGGLCLLAGLGRRARR